MKKQITTEQQELIASLKHVFDYDIPPALAADFHVGSPTALGDWSYWAKENDIPRAYCSDAYLTQDQIHAFAGELSARINEALAASGKTCPELLVPSYNPKERDVAFPMAFLQELQAAGTVIPLGDIFDKYRAIEEQRLTQMRNLRDRMNDLSGYPVWQQFSHAKHRSNSPFIYINTPEGTKDARSQYMPYNYGAQIEDFIRCNGLDGVMEYSEVSHRDGFDSRFQVTAATPDAIESAVEQLEGELREEFRTLVRGMLLEAQPQAVLWSLNQEAVLDVLRRRVSGTIDALSAEIQEQPIAVQTQGLRALAERYETVREMIADLALHETESSATLLDTLGEKIPALADFIAEQRQAQERGKFAARHPRRDNVTEPDGTGHGKV